MNDSPPEDFRNMEDILRKILSQAFGQGQIRPGVIGVNIIMAGNLPAAKVRLRLVPHATLSIEAKQQMSS